ncbi:MAG: succinylglutamate desuccinylase/aspartoacylase family protein [Phycisphaerales bacterium]|nr:succinylglutamate desuccinylase/aspartoacylase family protein [Phycisphaerales bacterium]
MRYSFLKIHSASDLSRRRLPVMEAHSGAPGPVVWLTACAHGDEVGGLVVIQEIFKRLRKHPLQRGSLHAFPMMNPLGFEVGTRQIAASEEDLNRSFPGSPTGTLAERIADRIFSTIMTSRPAAAIGLHNDWIHSIPYAVVDPLPPEAPAEVASLALRLASSSGFLIIRDDDHLRRTLPFALMTRGVPSITIELGEAYVVNEKNVDFGVQSVWSMLGHLGVIDPPQPPFVWDGPAHAMGRVLPYTARPYASMSGVLRFLVRPGAVVKPGQPVARVYNAFGKLQETINAPSEAVVLGHADSSVAFPGAPVMAFGRMDDGQATA